MTNDFQKTIEGLDDEGLATLAATVGATIEARRAVDISTIKTGMSPEDRAKVLAAIQRAAPR